MSQIFETVAVGGTFDLFHHGHLALLIKAFEVGNHVLIGLSSDDFVKKSKKPHKIAPYNHRLEELIDFLKSKKKLDRAEIMPLNHAYGVTLSDKRLDALVVSEETEPIAHEINRKRKSLGLLHLPIVTVRMVLSEDLVPISSTRIWFGEIDREGHLL
ncbi:phosphopantetheine adenylyltransferase [Candidatus Bathyarchaeota archaeon]|nr:phosphopantetheine adenylyltransferase [Candidatus Bathyarchaeota archaeon]